MSTTIQDTVQKFTADPQAGRVAPTVQASLANGRARVSSGPFNWDADLPPVVGGENQAPSPTAYVLGALAACAVAFVNDTLAPEFGVEVEDLSAEARCATDLGGLVGVAGADPRLKDFTLSIVLTSSSPADSIDALQQAWLARCPVYLALMEPSGVDVAFETRRA